MSEPILMKGNEAIAEAAIRAGCRFFAGYPITPQNELPEYMSRRMPEVGGVFLQAESEVAAINMLYGASGAGARCLTSSSSPGISLKQEGISYMCGAELPAVIINIVRGGPGLGNIQPAQSDYFQATRGGGHGDYRTVVYGPASLQEMVELVMEAFDVADRYRNPVMVLGDGILGQMMEPVVFADDQVREPQPKPWATTGARGRERRVLSSIYLEPEDLDHHNWKLEAKYEQMRQKEARYELVQMEDAELCLVAYGTTARICRTALEKARSAGLKVGMIRPITLWPFPVKAFGEAGANLRAYLVVEMSTGQMVEDVRLAVNGARPVAFYGKTGGAVMLPQQVVDALQDLAAREGVGR
ncbi:MAG: 3-methyl-2-oxobutanoate dehydrogenase subunit VorB [Bacillota bacterium]